MYNLFDCDIIIGKGKYIGCVEFVVIGVCNIIGFVSVVIIFFDFGGDVILFIEIDNIC